jgi:hypothetical protein
VLPSCNHSLLGAASVLTVQAAIAANEGMSVVVLILLFLAVHVGTSSNPGAAVIERSILAGEVVALAPIADVVTATLGQIARSGRQLRGHGGISGNPVGEGVLAILDNGLASLVSIVGSAGLAGSNGGIINQLNKVLSVAGNDGNLLAVLTQGIELVGVSGLDLLAGDVGELCLGDKRLGLGTDELLFENDNLRRVGLLVLELSDLVGNLLLACQMTLLAGLQLL